MERAGVNLKMEKRDALFRSRFVGTNTGFLMGWSFSLYLSIPVIIITFILTNGFTIFGCPKRLAIIVPFRERFEELLEFAPHMNKFLEKQNIKFDIFAIQQRDNLRFNRGTLVNVGYLYTKNDYHYIAIHDIDILPLNDDLKYGYPNVPFRLATPITQPYNMEYYELFSGGILIINNEDFEKVGGMSNNYWGWGDVDGYLYESLSQVRLRPKKNMTDNDDFRYTNRRAYRTRDVRKCFIDWQTNVLIDRKIPLSDVAYTIMDTHNVAIDSVEVTILDVELACNVTATPWCLCPPPDKPVIVKPFSGMTFMTKAS